MATYIVRRLIYSVLVIVGVSVVVFIVTHMLGDPVRLMLPLEASAEEVAQMRHQLGFDQPVYVQFWAFASKALVGDFGDSLWQRTPALQLVLERLPASLLLSIVAMVIAVVGAIPLGILAAIRPRSLLDRACVIVSLAGVCLPVFWLGMVFILLFAVGLGWFKTSGYGGWQYLTLPALTLAALPLGRITQIVRSSMIDELHRTYMSTARAKGLKESTVVMRHALKNAAIPIVTLAAWELTRMLAGYTIVVEKVFAWPGYGQLAIEAIERRDLPLIQADVFVVALIVVALNIVVDLLYGALDPRVRFA
ncbi:MAG: ABC transporter permease [Chloroflexi bacterium]|nr:ABC transporter permease [Chloroflexota bacterium]